MVKFRDNLYVGNYRDSHDDKLLLDGGITAVLNVAYEIDDPVYPPFQIRYAKVGLMDNHMNYPYIKELAVETLIAMLQDGETVLVHCAAGLSRSVYTACQAIAHLEERDITGVYDELKKLHPFAMYGPLFQGTHPMTTYYRDLENETNTDDMPVVFEANNN